MSQRRGIEGDDVTAADRRRGLSGALARRLAEYVAVVQGVDLEAVSLVAFAVRAAVERSASVFVVGNGGSAATASHLAADLRKAARHLGHRPVRMWPLSDQLACTTAVSNDHGYEHVFSLPLRESAVTGDLLFVLSVSGESPNVLSAARAARELGVTVVALTGRSGSTLWRLADVRVGVAHDDYGQVEDAHSWICHAVAASMYDGAVIGPDLDVGRPGAGGR